MIETTDLILYFIIAVIAIVAVFTVWITFTAYIKQRVESERKRLNFHNKHIPLPENYLKSNGGSFRPYESVEEANHFIAYKKWRYPGLTVLIKEQDGTVAEYWYKEGREDSDLIRKPNVNPLVKK